MSVPCKDCLIIPICRNKYFKDMKESCSKVEEYLFCGMVYNRRRKDFIKRASKVEKVLKPMLWDVGVKERPMYRRKSFVTYLSISR
jgi:hypothetical protein